MDKYQNAFHATSQPAWREWLTQNHDKQSSIWLIIYKKGSGVDTVYYPEAVDEALCFGWVDSKPNKRDDVSYYQYFSPRNPKSNWSRVNKAKVARLEKEGRMATAGRAMVTLAKANGTWDALNDVENLIVPDDLLVAFNKFDKAKTYWEAFPPSTQRGILEWIFNAKTTATRQKRISETARLANTNIRANQYRQPKKK